MLKRGSSLVKSLRCNIDSWKRTKSIEDRNLVFAHSSLDLADEMH